MWLFSFFLLISATFAQDFDSAKYQKQTRSAKLQQIMSAIKSDSTPLQFPNALQLAEIFVESMTPTMNYTGDKFPNQYVGKFLERNKLIHTVGVSAAATFKVTANPRGYTGLFQSGCDAVVLRFSTATPPAPNAPAEGAFVPGIGLKFLRNNATAANMFAMYSLVGQENYNFFEHDFSNHVPQPGQWVGGALKALEKKFRSVSSWPTMIGLSDMARWDQNGQQVRNPKFPYRLVFHPNTRYHTTYPSEWNNTPYWEYLPSFLKPGQVYSVYAQDEPLDGNSDIYKIGDISIVGKATTSFFGDRHMFLQHTAMEVDLKMKPEWVSPAQQDVDAQAAVPAPGYHYPDLPW